MHTYSWICINTIYLIFAYIWRNGGTFVQYIIFFRICWLFLKKLSQPLSILSHWARSIFLDLPFRPYPPSKWIITRALLFAVNYWYDMQYDVKYNYFKFVEGLKRKADIFWHNHLPMFVCWYYSPVSRAKDSVMEVESVKSSQDIVVYRNIQIKGTLVLSQRLRCNSSYGITHFASDGVNESSPAGTVLGKPTELMPGLSCQLPLLLHSPSPCAARSASLSFPGCLLYGNQDMPQRLCNDFVTIHVLDAIFQR